MDKEKFLQSGLLEQHVLGLTSVQEDKLVQEYLQTYPELQSEVEHLRRVLHSYAEDHQIPAPASSQPVQVSTPPYSSIANWLTLLLAIACSVLWWQGQQKQQQITTLQAEQAALLTYCSQQEATAAAQQKVYALIENPETRSILLRGSGESFFAIAYWNETEKGGWLSPTHLPPIKPNEQYQVWADVDGVMKSVGLIPKEKKGIITLDYLPTATSINITKEPLGGSEHPHVEYLTLNGML